MVTFKHIAVFSPRHFSGVPVTASVVPVAVATGQKQKEMGKSVKLHLHDYDQSLLLSKQYTLISRVGSISKRPPHWIYYNLHMYISHKQVYMYFACIKTYQVF